MGLFKFDTTRRPNKDTFFVNPVTGTPFSRPPRMGWFGTIAAIALGLLVLYCVRHSNQESMTKETIATVTDSALYSGNRVNVYYTFHTDKRSYTFSKVYDHLEPKEVSLLINKKFPLVYNPIDPDVHLLLLNKDDFDEVDHTQPDSLKLFNKLFQ